MNIPESIRFCVNELENKGFAAYLVGGCVRDHFLGLQPHDFDICTDSTSF